MSDRRWNRPPVVVLTALDVEYDAVRDMLADLWQPPPVAGTRFEIGSLGGGSGEVVLALTGPGNHASAVIAERAIREFAPTAVLFAGVAGRLRPSLALGDVVVATQVYAYHGAAARTDGLKSRPRVWEHDDDALAIEMEAAGVAKAGRLSAAPVAVIRAISDRADGTKAGTDGQRWQPRAVRNAATFATALAADLISGHPGRAGRDPGPPEIHVGSTGGSHGAVAGVSNGGVHNGVPPTGRRHEERGRR